MAWALVVTLNIGFGIAVATLWVKYLGSRNAKAQKRGVGYRREEIEIDPANVPQFKPTWRDAR